MKVKPFRGIRPPQALAKQVSSRPYDVLNSDEARQEAAGHQGHRQRPGGQQARRCVH